MLIDRFRYKNTLSRLWNNVFGDSQNYIELIFNKECKDSILCFAELEGSEAVSAFYLLGSNLAYNGKSYKGYYLYAAATDINYRGKGLMAKIINEAQDYCRENGYDFISLVPSEKSLYGYYSRFGFVSAMYGVSISSYTPADSYSSIPFDVYYALREKYCKNHIIYDKDAFIYAADCLKASGYDFFSDGNSILIKNSEDEIIEMLSSDYENYEKYPFGMLYPISSELNSDWKYTDIYMNIALD